MGKRIILIVFFGMVGVSWQASMARAGMMENLLHTLKQQSPAPSTTHSASSPSPIPAQELLPGQKADEIVVYKSEHRLELRVHGKTIRHYRVALGRNPVGHKLYQGDNRTPEGRYRIDMRNANSQFYRSLRISYPDRTDRDVALTVGVSPGDWIMIHGQKNTGPARNAYTDWTNGCIAVTNREMDEIWSMVDVGTPITIWP